MPQLGYKIEAINWDPYIVSILTPTDQQALKRVGFGKSEWDELDWFVRFARLDLDKASQGELLSLQEEIVALLTAHLRNRPELTRSAIPELGSRGGVDTARLATPRCPTFPRRRA